eukprot:CAMPEP_0183308156 /NCGR_PEP_ID=MMETSP0160_2-20130417/20109_1 /TAXON_ID=2839 ORGANISM="Odontella Sinensis, Strain Grunow 1884" /NCGR_SAMPLE_ID=MMETSP0160_2 /ASSEMBLY_ACC=CAM_ASM_000250 /LENGTH=241 /DNA_ID=CAMNT_0025471919 /DNA_START=48 /DNA_END=770 /DNA_ORIENTATION=+
MTTRAPRGRRRSPASAAALLPLLAATEVGAFAPLPPRSPVRLPVLRSAPYASSSARVVRSWCPPPASRASSSSSSSSSLRMSSSSSGPLDRISGLGRGRPLLSEDDVAEPPDKRVVEAMERSGSERAIASDIAAKAGVSLSIARKSLSTLATLTGGDIAVTSDGELLYTFPKDLRGALASNSARYAALQTFEKIWPKLFYGIRVGFGVLLFVSIFAIFSTVFFVFSAGGGSSRDDRDDRRG